MSSLLVGLIFVPLLDQGLKQFLIRSLGSRSIPLGALGRLEVVRTRVWLARITRRMPSLAWWVAWALAAGALAVVTVRVPACGWAAGLLLGGALSHLLESTLRGWICDFVRLRFWPAFNLADVAIAAGALGLAGRLVILLSQAATSLPN